MFDITYLNKIGSTKQRYYTCDPDAGTYFVSMSDLSEEQKQYIVEKFDLDIDEEEFVEPSGYITRYVVEAPCGFYDTEGHIFYDLCNYLHSEGFIEK
jgi:hypothetical protein